jgi:hypothetical protein
MFTIKTAMDTAINTSIKRLATDSSATTHGLHAPYIH